MKKLFEKINKKYLLALALLIGLALLTFQHILNSKYGKFVRVGDMNYPRFNHSSIMLKNGKVLIINGGKEDYKDVNEIEIFDPITKKFHYTNQKIDNHTIFLISFADYKFALFNEFGVRIYDAQKNILSPLIEMSVPRSSYCATLLKDKRILITGGQENVKYRPAFVGESEIFDIKTNKFMHC